MKDVVEVWNENEKLKQQMEHIHDSFLKTFF